MAAYRSFRRAGMLRPQVDLLHGCDCANCCQTADNMRVGRFFGPIRPLVARRLAPIPDDSVFGDANPKQDDASPPQRTCGK